MGWGWGNRIWHLRRVEEEYPCVLVGWWWQWLPSACSHPLDIVHLQHNLFEIPRAGDLGMSHYYFHMPICFYYRRVLSVASLASTYIWKPSIFYPVDLLILATCTLDLGSIFKLPYLIPNLLRNFPMKLNCGSGSSSNNPSVRLSTISINTMMTITLSMPLTRHACT
jgi:hypothetical protein